MEPMKKTTVRRLPTLATKADIANLRRDIKRWIIATVLAIVGSDLLALLVIYKL